MAAIMLITGLVWDLPELTKTQITNALAAAGSGAVSGNVNGIPITVRREAILAVSDSVEGLRPTVMQPDAVFRSIPGGETPDPNRPVAASRPSSPEPEPDPSVAEPDVPAEVQSFSQPPVPPPPPEQPPPAVGEMPGEG